MDVALRMPIRVKFMGMVIFLIFSRFDVKMRANLCSIKSNVFPVKRNEHTSQYSCATSPDLFISGSVGGDIANRFRKISLGAER
jgi:hypothetical protein